MAEAGVIGLLLALCRDVGDIRAEIPLTSKRGVELAARLARILMQSRTVAAQDLEQAIRSSEAAQCFSASTCTPVLVAFLN